MSTGQKQAKIMIIKIICCQNCIHIDYNDNHDYCNHPNWESTGTSSDDLKIEFNENDLSEPMIPEWCPLENA